MVYNTLMDPEKQHEIVQEANEWEARKLFEFLESVRKRTDGMLRERSEEEVHLNIDGFITIKKDGEIIACWEIIKIWEDGTLELWALAVDEKYQWNWFSDMIISYAESHAKKLIIVTNNEVLEKKLKVRGYSECGPEYNWRKERSPRKRVYIKYS